MSPIMTKRLWSLLLLTAIVFPAARLSAGIPPPPPSPTVDCPHLRCVAGQSVVVSLPFEVGPNDAVTWDFGDGTKISTAGTARVAHQYRLPGLYRLAVTLHSGAPSSPLQIRVVPAPPVYLRFGREEYDAREEEGQAVLDVLRSGDLSRPLTVTYSYERIDRDRLRGTIAFAPGQTTALLTVPIENDDVYRTAQLPPSVDLESDEVLFPNGVTAFVNVRDDEPPALLSVDDIRVPEGDAGRTRVMFTIRLSRPISEQAWLSLTLRGGTATSEEDFVRGPLPFYIEAGQTTRQIAVDVIGDTKPEPDEHFILRVHSLFTATYEIARSEARGVIVNDDESFADDDLRVPAGTRATLTLRGGESTDTQVIALTSSDPSVVEVPASVTLAPGEILATFDVDAKTAGRATVHAGSAVATVHVFDLLVPSFASASLRVPIGRTESVALVTTPARGTPFAATITSSDPSVVAVASPAEIASGTGTVSFTALKAGRTTITATMPASLGGMSATMEIVVEPGSSRRRPR